MCHRYHLALNIADVTDNRCTLLLLGKLQQMCAFVVNLSKVLKYKVLCSS